MLQAMTMDEVGKFFLGLLGDVMQAQADLAREDNQYHRRNLVRVVYSAVDGITSVLKHLALEMGQPTGKLSPEQITMLREQSHNLDDQGRARARPANIPTESNFRFAVTTFFNLVDPGFRLDVSDKTYQAFKTGLDIRHRITHPKVSRDFEISEEECKKVRLGAVWVFKALFLDREESIHKIIDEMSTSAEERAIDKARCTALVTQYNAQLAAIK